ncbi:hypothetical protein [Variovorax arabinosiphilus]|uniref:hypothetical protein n=1 Tax=Variovorax arabinosiphilus TaxID=3053498 RepID=UPI002577B212|nr:MULTISPECIES: hypothetical protein [unclassified Variovorax]MDM0119079.1 hypothetical protein [Variovorax sp. J2L1-78]MDM0129505.1 hypothetical protein [Variovorax sp. J2L1-63]MDM0232709.1 hypothetical protein [Variovorax sp. J2R1-6]
MRIANITLPLGILLVSAVAETAIGYGHSVDARGWWPLGLSVALLLYAGYSVVFGLIAGDRILPMTYIVGVNGVLAAARVLASYLFFTVPMDWGVVNAGMTQLSFFQTLVRSAWTFYLLPIPFLVAHFVALRGGWPNVNQQPRNSPR